MSIEREIQKKQLIAVLDTSEGRAVLWRLLESTGLYRSSYTGDEGTYFNEGRRNVGLELLALINSVAPDKYPLIMAENTHDRHNRDDGSASGSD